MTFDVSYDQVPNNPVPDNFFTRALVKVVNNILRGKVNCIGTVTLNTSASTTAVTNVFVGGTSVVSLTPQTANAAAEIGNGTLYVSSVGDQNFVLTHANNTQADRTYGYTVFG